ncbi:Hypothetical protein CINCED_3A000961 [Cinara cedri]|uniref:Uncharacterized protein n=1 Tax=Cinara cedri TaxID=506608 RepID=A0A5E4MMJ1_9HEMI|nr:Hypothetical protein CINCED_3A000961 [Cinara cedri]
MSGGKSSSVIIISGPRREHHPPWETQLVDTGHDSNNPIQSPSLKSMTVTILPIVMFHEADVHLTQH